jgi:hypothetical protein
VTSDGSAYARFRRALDARNPHWASTAALELEHVGLADAVELTLIYLDKEPARYERAALRLHARLNKEVRWGFEESLAALGLLAALRGRQAQEAAHALASLLPVNQKLLPVSKVLVGWATEQRGIPKSAAVERPESPNPSASR